VLQPVEKPYTVLMLKRIDCPEKGQAFGQRAKQAALE
jgi:hypothetical protein